MKRNILTISLLALVITGVNAQNEQDVLRYSFLQTGGTTRSLSLGGATGAIGADFSSLAVNPAGLAVFRTGEFSISGDYNSYTSKASYLDNSLTDNSFRMGLSHFGLVIPLKSNKEGSGLKGINFGIGYNKLRDYGQYITMKGVNGQNSLVDQFVRTANQSGGSWDKFSDGLAWETWLIDYDSIAGVYYSDFDGSNYGQTQRRTVSSRGVAGEYDFSVAANLSDRIYVGATLGVQRVDYSEVWEHSETDPDDVINFFNGFTYRNSLSTSGSGVNLKLGILARPVDFIRIGASLQTPTVLKLNDDFRSYMSTDLNDGKPRHEYDAIGEFNYSVSTPLRATASAAFIIKQYGLISIDYEYVDYSSGRLRSSDYDFFDENEAVASRYKPASNIRLGAEARVLNSYYIRGGFALYGSPYVSGELNAGNNLSVISAGFGYRDQKYYFDLGLSSASSEQAYVLYGSNSAAISNNTIRVGATIGFRF